MVLETLLEVPVLRLRGFRKRLWVLVLPTGLLEDLEHRAWGVFMNSPLGPISTVRLRVPERVSVRQKCSAVSSGRVGRCPSGTLSATLAISSTGEHDFV